MIIQTKFCGDQNIESHQLIYFPAGIFGFEGMQRYALLDAAQPGFFYLQSIDDTDLAFILIHPHSFRPDYSLELQLEELKLIQSPSAEELLVFAIVTIPVDVQQMTANLQGPILINRKKLIGVQGIQTNPVWKTKHRVFEELATLGV